MTKIQLSSFDTQYRILLPVQLCEHALKENLSSQFRLYCYLKSACSGKIKFNNQGIKEAGAALQCHPKTIISHLDKLQQLNWIGYNPKSQYYFIRGFEKVMELHELTARTGAEFHKDYLKTFKNFLAGAVIGFMVNTIRKRQAFERKTGRSRHKACPSNGYQLSTRCIAKKLNVSLGFASMLKKLAARAGFIKIRKSYIQTAFKTREKKHYRKAFPEHAGRVRNMEGKIVLVDCDKILSTMRFKTRKKRERYKTGLQPLNCTN